MPTGGPGDDVFTAAVNGQEAFDGSDGNDTVSYSASTTGVYANLATGQSTPLLKIMPFGDSITYGVISVGTVINEESGGYRKPLWEDFQAADLALDFVGKFQNGPTTFDRDHAGIRGKTIDYLNQVDKGFLTAYKPDAVLLMTGANDTGGNATIMINKLRALLISMTDASPGTTVFVSTIPPRYDPARNAVVNKFNALIPGLVDQLDDTRLIKFVDMTGLTLADITPPPEDKGTHPTAAGYEKIAQYWFNALANSNVLAGQADSLTSIENLTGSAFNDRLVGEAGNNVLTGLAGNDELTGGDGNDTLDGGEGNDTLNGGAGADHLTGGNGNDIYIVDGSDVVIEGAGGGSDTVQTDQSYSLLNQPNVENIVYTGTSEATLTGNAANNSITGGSGADTIDGKAGNDTIDGKAGADTMIGGSGNDTYYVDDAGDMIIEASSSGTDKVMSAITYTLGTGLDNLTLTGSAAIDGTGNQGTNVITGNTAANTLSGLGGNDTLIGLAGDDRLDGGIGTDILRGGAGADVLIGGTGNDRFDFDSISESGLGASSDQILDFVKGQDRIDLGGIDARAGTSANDAFALIGSSAFSGVAGQLRFETVDGPGGPTTLVQGDVNGDGVADFAIALVGQSLTFQASDFIL
jgi:Ca2+-binding RTX toxin-like protein